MDSFKIAARYPIACPNCRINSDIWYGEFDVKVFRKVNTNTGLTTCTNNQCPTIFLTPGGGFASLIEAGLYNNDSIPNDTIGLANSLANQGFTAVVIRYKTAIDSSTSDAYQLSSMLFTCTSSKYVKAKFEYYQLAAFHDYRRLLNIYLTNTDSISKYNIDTNKVILAGFSAGAYTVLNTLFLDSVEMPISIPNLPAYLSSKYNEDLKRSFYPIPKIKGIIAFTGGTIYPNYYQNNLNKNIPLYLLHGTCDHLITQDTGLIPYKCPPYNYNIPLNNGSVTSYVVNYGSSWLFKKLVASGYKTWFDQVCKGGHNVIPSKNDNNYSVGTDNCWDEYTPKPDAVAPGSVGYNNYLAKLAYWQANRYKNLTDPVEPRIIAFANSILNNTPPFNSRLGGFVAEGPEIYCKNDTDIIYPITNITLSGVSNMNYNLKKFATITGGQEAILFYWIFGGNPNKIYTTTSRTIDLDSVPSVVEFSECSDLVGICCITRTCNKREINLTAVSGCDTISYLQSDSISYSFTYACSCGPPPSPYRLNTGIDDYHSGVNGFSLKLIGNKKLQIVCPEDRDEGVLQVIDTKGAIVARTQQQLLKGENIVSIDVKDILSAGNYFVSYISPNYVQAIQIFIP